jgi:hypothetical protein
MTESPFKAVTERFKSEVEEAKQKLALVSSGELLRCLKHVYEEFEKLSKKRKELFARTGGLPINTLLGCELRKLETQVGVVKCAIGTFNPQLDESVLNIMKEVNTMTALYQKTCNDVFEEDKAHKNERELGSKALDLEFFQLRLLPFGEFMITGQFAGLPSGLRSPETIQSEFESSWKKKLASSQGAVDAIDRVEKGLSAYPPIMKVIDGPRTTAGSIRLITEGCEFPSGLLEVANCLPRQVISVLRSESTFACLWHSNLVDTWLISQSLPSDPWYDFVTSGRGGEPRIEVALGAKGSAFRFSVLKTKDPIEAPKQEALMRFAYESVVLRTIINNHQKGKKNSSDGKKPAGKRSKFSFD